MQKLIPHLWFDTQAKEAAEFYVEAFGNLPTHETGSSKVINITTLHDTPSGDADTVTFEIWGYTFMAISAGPYFTLNPSISFFVNFDPSKDPNAKENLTALWEKLSQDGTALMQLDEYPFSKWYGWIQDKYGVSWQLILTDPDGDDRPTIIPSLLFVGSVCGRAEEAMSLYQSVFKNSQQGLVARYPAGMEPDKEGTVMFADFKLEDQWLVVMDSAQDHKFMFNEALSFMVMCETQEEIDYYWEKLSAVPEAEQCGWLKDKFGVSWQIVPTIMGELLASDDKEKVARVTQAFLKMKKFDIAALLKAPEGL